MDGKDVVRETALSSYPQPVSVLDSEHNLPARIITQCQYSLPPSLHPSLPPPSLSPSLLHLSLHPSPISPSCCECDRTSVSSSTTLKPQSSPSLLCTLTQADRTSVPTHPDDMVPYRRPTKVHVEVGITVLHSHQTVLLNLGTSEGARARVCVCVCACVSV